MAPPEVRAGTRKRAFFDASILIYAEDAADPHKQGIASRLVAAHALQGTLVISVPVLGEYYSVATGRLHLDPAKARRQVEFFSRSSLVEPVLAEVLAAIDMQRLHGFQNFDAFHLRCAQRAGCNVFYSEDLHHGQVIDGTRILNPFL